MRPIYNIGDTKPLKTSVQTQRSVHVDDEEEDTPSGAKWYLKSVRNLINVFEQKDKENHRMCRPNLNKMKSKSYANLRQPINRTKDVVSRFENHKPKLNSAFPELDALKNTANSLKSKITGTTTIDSKECIIYQNQIIALLTKIGSLESNGNPLVKEEKQKCLKIVQSCNTALKNKTGEEGTTPMALGSFVKTLTKFETNNNETVSKVKILRGIFEAKKDNVIIKKYQKDLIKPSKPPLVIDNEFTYTPYNEYIKRKNSEEKIDLSSMPKMQDTSKSCENIASHDYSGIKRLLNRLNDKKKEIGHHRAKSLTDIKVDNEHSMVSSVEDVTSAKSVSIEHIATVEVTNNHSNEEENTISDEQEPDVKLVSVKPAEDAEIPVIVIREQYDTPVFNGNGEESTSESDEDSESEDHKHSSGFYSFVGDETFDDSFHDASDQEIKSDANFVNSYYEPYNNVKCKMANGIVNITLNGVQVE